MNPIRALCFFAGCVATAHAADWQALSDTPAAITVIHMQPTPLVESKDGWLRVPAKFTRNNATIYMPDKTSGGTNGVADITVIRDGFLLLVCDYSYQGNSSGDWQKETWDARTFKQKGWHLLNKNEMDGLLLDSGNKEQTVFYKNVKAGQNFRLRCNKYQPPYPVVLGSVPPPASVVPAKK